MVRSTVDAVPLTGFGFDDGVLILRALSVAPASRSFTTASGAPGPLDAFGPDDFSGQLSVAGTGTVNATLAPLVFGTNASNTDPGFMQSPLATVDYANLDAVALPYTLVNPSDCFTSVASPIAVGASQISSCDNLHVLGPFSAQNPSPGYVPVTGAINGVSGPDFDPQVVFTTRAGTIPEPATLTLLGLGLRWLGFSRRKH